MLNTHLDKMEIGKVYVGKFIKSGDIPTEKLIATQFYVEEIGDRPVQLFVYARRSKPEMETWYRGKYQTDYRLSETLKDSLWYIWLPPDNPNYLNVIRRVRETEIPVNNTDETTDLWGEPI